MNHSDSSKMTKRLVYNTKLNKLLKNHTYTVIVQQSDIICHFPIIKQFWSERVKQDVVIIQMKVTKDDYADIFLHELFV